MCILFTASMKPESCHNVNFIVTGDIGGHFSVIMTNLLSTLWNMIRETMFSHISRGEFWKEWWFISIACCIIDNALHSKASYYICTQLICLQIITFEILVVLLKLMKQYGFDYNSPWLNTTGFTMLKVNNQKTNLGHIICQLQLDSNLICLEYSG